MNQHLRANLMLLLLTLVLCSVVYPGALWIIGQTAFQNQAQGSLVDRNGQPTTSEKDAVGSRLIAQAFTGDEYFQPRPSAASFNGAASAASNWGASNSLLRDRVARQLGPIVKYRSGAKKGQPVGPNIEAWFQKDQFQGKPGIVAQWAQAHPSLAANWVVADPLNGKYVLKEGCDIKSIFFDMWLQDHPDADLEPVPADMVMASGSGLDPHITLSNALYQLDRVSAKWAEKTKRDPSLTRAEIETLLREHAHAPLGGLAGVDLVNVLDVNLALNRRYGS